MCWERGSFCSETWKLQVQAVAVTGGAWALQEQLGFPAAEVRLWGSSLPLEVLLATYISVATTKGSMVAPRF